MNIGINTIIESCQWFPSHFLIFSGNVFSPLLYYTYLGSVIPVIFIGCIILFKDSKKLANRLLFMSIISFTLWVFSALIIWATEFPSYLMFFWALINIFEPFIYFFAFYFIYVFLYKKDFSFIKKVLLIVPIIPVILLTYTNFTILGFDLSNCDRAAVDGIMVFYNYGIEILYTILLIVTSLIFIIKNKMEKRKAILILIGILAFLLSFALGNILESLTENWYIGQYGLFGAPIFVGFLAYMIVKFKSFNIKLLGAQVLVFALGFLVLAIAFIRRIENVRIIVFFTLIFVIILGYLLIRSVRREVKQREQLEILTEELFKANEKLKGLDRLKTEFLSLASHQLRSPLTAIKGYASMLSEGDFGELNPKAKDAVETIFTASKNLTVVVEDLLNVTKIESGGMKYEMVNFDLGEVAQEMTKELSVTAEKKGLKMQYTNDGLSPYTVFGDKEKIRQVVLNFIDNSMKYTKEGSIDVSLAKKGGKIIFSVKDTGMGMTPQIKETLFQKFARGDGAKMNTTGSGLGLYLAKEIVKAHKGNVGVDSEGMGKGSTFYVELDSVKA